MATKIHAHIDQISSAERIPASGNYTIAISDTMHRYFTFFGNENTPVNPSTINVAIPIATASGQTLTIENKTRQYDSFGGYPTTLGHDLRINNPLSVNIYTIGVDEEKTFIADEPNGGLASFRVVNTSATDVGAVPTNFTYEPIVQMGEDPVYLPNRRYSNFNFNWSGSALGERTIYLPPFENRNGDILRLNPPPLQIGQTGVVKTPAVGFESESTLIVWSGQPLPIPPGQENKSIQVKRNQGGWVLDYTIYEHKSRHAIGGQDPLSPSDIGAAAANEVVYTTGDQTISGNKTFLDPLQVGTGDISLFVSDNGSVGINNEDPQATLDVSGTARVSGLSFLSLTGDSMIPAHKEGLVFYDDNSKSLSFYNEISDITVNIGQEQLIRVKNAYSDKPILNGRAVVISGQQGDRPKVIYATADNNFINDHDVVGVATHEIPANGDGYVTVNGLVNGIKTDTFVNGHTLYVSTSGSGILIDERPIAPNHAIKVGYVARSHQNDGAILVHLNQGEHLDQLHDVSISNPQSGDFLLRDGDNIWKNKSVLFSDVAVFTSNGTWTKPDGAKSVEIAIIGGGGGGGAGRYGASSTSRGGGGGGGGGGFTFLNLNAASLLNSIPVTVGVGGAGGAAQTSIGSDGNPGNPGGSSNFGDYGIAYGGLGGAGGISTTATSSANGGIGVLTGGNGGVGSIGTSSSKNASSAMSAGGGGGGGGCSSSNVNSVGGKGGPTTIVTLSGGIGGATNGGAGANGETLGVNQSLPGSGGGGGGGTNIAPDKGGDGGNGGLYGGGGGGGAGSNGSTSSGKGGNGAPGIVVVITYF
jgi:hypothetical protein